MLGQSVPDWLLKGGTVLLRNFTRNKSEPLGIQVELLGANPKYALIRYADGHESTVSTGDLAPYPVGEGEQESAELIEEDKDGLQEEPNQNESSDTLENSLQESLPKSSGNSSSSSELSDVDVPPPLRRSTRITRRPDRYGYD